MFHEVTSCAYRRLKGGMSKAFPVVFAKTARSGE